MHTRVTVETVQAENPAAVVVATGAVPLGLDELGVIVINGKNVVQANEVILGTAKTGQKVVVVGGRYLGMEIADQLADEGKRVSLVTRRSIGRAIERNVYLTLRNRLIQKGVYLYPYRPVVEVIRRYRGK